MPRHKNSPGQTQSPETVLVGQVIRPHGLRGEVRIEIHSDVPGRFDVGRRLWLVLPGQRPTRVKITGFRPVKGGALLQLDGYEDRDQAETLRGGRFEVDLEEVPEAPEGYYYYYELVGCRCFDARHGELGEVVEVLEDGGGVLLQVKDRDRSLLVPFVEAFLQGVDTAGGRIDLSLPPGLVETCVSRS